MKSNHFQIAVVGAGFGGALTAMIARRLGFSVVLLERGRHPRFAIGESTTPLTNLLLEEIADGFSLPFLRPLCKWGSWQRERPELACGLKRGFTFYHHELDRPFAPDPEHRRQLMVGASPRDEVADTHWYRPDFDQYLVREAERLGVDYRDEVGGLEISEFREGWQFHGQRHDVPLEITADFVIDATGPRGFLHRAWQLPEEPFAGLPPTQALFSHFTGVAPLPACFDPGHPAPPFPPLNAAVHHVFPGGWVWVLTFNNSITSAGVAVTDALASDLNLAEGAPAWQQLLHRLPSLGEMFQSAQATVPFVHQPRLAFQSTRLTGPGWAQLPSAAGVIDPLLSTGFPLTLLGITRLARILELHWNRPSFQPALENYARQTRSELQITARLVGALYATMDRFEVFKSLTLLYFAAASYSESARRLGKTHLVDSFLLGNNPAFRSALDEFGTATTNGPLSAPEAESLASRIRAAIAPFDVAGLTDQTRDPWYPSDVQDLLENGAKLDASRAEIMRMLEKCGLGAE